MLKMFIATAFVEEYYVTKRAYFGFRGVQGAFSYGHETVEVLCVSFQYLR